MTSVETLPPTSAINKFLYTISTDEMEKLEEIMYTIMKHLSIF